MVSARSRILTLRDEWNKRTEFTFSEPVDIPGHVLTAGKYVFELADNSSDRNIVEIFSQDSNGKEAWSRPSWRFPIKWRRLRTNP